MSVIYTIPNNKPFSSWIVSENESEKIMNCILSKKESKRCSKASSKNMERIRKTIGTQIEVDK